MYGPLTSSWGKQTLLRRLMAGHLHFFAPLHSSAFQTVEHSSCLLTCFYHTYSLALISLLPPTLQSSPHGVNHTLLAAHLCLPRLWVWCCLAQLLGYPLLFLSIYSLWALPPGSLDVDVLLLTKKKGKRNQTCTVFTKGNTYLRYFDCIDLALECGDLFKCTLCTMELKLHCTACWLLVVLC